MTDSHPRERLAALDWTQLRDGAVLGLVALAVVLVVVGALNPAGIGWIEGRVSTVGLFLPLLGVVLVVVVATRIRDSNGLRTVSSLPVEGIESAPSSRVDSTPGPRYSRRLKVARRHQYQATRSTSEDEIRETLLAGARWALRTSGGLSAAEAERAVETGEWTDDPVAAAFLSEQLLYPLDELCRGVLDPGSSYERRVRRTLDAIDRVGTAESASAETSGRAARETAEEATPSHPHGTNEDSADAVSGGGTERARIEGNETADAAAEPTAEGES